MFTVNNFHPYLGKIPILTNIFLVGLKSPRLEYVLVRFLEPRVLGLGELMCDLNEMVGFSVV